MYKEFIPYKEALALKKLDGFVFKEFGQYWKDRKDGEVFLFTGDDMEYEEDEPGLSDIEFICSSPLKQQALRWFREKYNLPSPIHTVWQYDWNNYSYQWHITENKEEWNCVEHFKTYEEAEQACLEKLIEIVNENKKD